MTNIVTFYRFFHCEDPKGLLAKGQELASTTGIQGTMIYSPQGVNATISGEREALEAFLTQIETWSGITIDNRKWSTWQGAPFRRLRMFYKEEILGLREEGADPRDKVGTYVEPSDWNALITRDDVTVIDVRNWYEVYAGKFEGAVDPKTETFHDFARFVQEQLDPAVNKHVARYCTGGIRCEVATSFLLDRGFENVFHLQGGILKYLEDVEQKDSTWEGECFVFDERVTVDHDLEPGTFERCRGCSAVLTVEDMKHPAYEEGVVCGHCHETRSPERISAARERMKQIRLSHERQSHERQAREQSTERTAQEIPA
ncbi:MAG: rhodanese-related sulfurtransferase [Polyangiales bacterium]